MIWHSHKQLFSFVFDYRKMDIKMFILVLVLFTMVKNCGSHIHSLTNETFHKGVANKPQFIMFFSTRYLHSYLKRIVADNIKCNYL